MERFLHVFSNPGFYVKARTSFMHVGHVPVSADYSVRVDGSQLVQKLFQRCKLLVCEIVFRRFAVFLLNTTSKTDSNAAMVVTFYVRTCGGDGATVFDASVSPYDFVVTDAKKTTRSVPPVYVFYSYIH